MRRIRMRGITRLSCARMGYIWTSAWIAQSHCLARTTIIISIMIIIAQDEVSEDPPSVGLLLQGQAMAVGGHQAELRPGMEALLNPDILTVTIGDIVTMMVGCPQDMEIGRDGAQTGETGMTDLAGMTGAAKLGALLTSYFLFDELYIFQIHS